MNAIDYWKQQMASIADTSYWGNQWKKVTDYSKATNDGSLAGDNEYVIDADCEICDKFLEKVIKIWFPEFHRGNIINFTVEKVPPDVQDKLKRGKGNAGAALTKMFLSKEGYYTGLPSIYFNKKHAFESQEILYYNMGHELLHVSQYLFLAKEKVKIDDSNRASMEDAMDYWAYSFEAILGRDRKASSFENETLAALSEQLGEVFMALAPSNFSWTNKCQFSQIIIK